MQPRSRGSARAVDALASAAPLATRWIERVLGAAEPPLTVAQYLALRAIAEEPLTGAELARRAGVSSAAVSQLVADLERLRLVARLPDPADRRRRVLQLTAEGTSVLASASTTLRERIGDVLGALPRPEVDALRRGLEQLDRLLTGVAPPRRHHPPRPPRHGRR